MRAVGSAKPLRDISFLANQVDALALHQLACPDPVFGPEPSPTILVTALAGTDGRRVMNALPPVCRSL
jgi:hypothetical protein